MSAPGERTDDGAEREREIAYEVVHFATRDGVQLAAESVGRSMTFLEQQVAELRAALESARADNERLQARLDATTQYAEELRDERALLWPAAQVLPTVEAQRDAERAKVQAVEALCRNAEREAAGGVRAARVLASDLRAALAKGAAKVSTWNRHD